MNVKLRNGPVPIDGRAIAVVAIVSGIMSGVLGMFVGTSILSLFGIGLFIGLSVYGFAVFDFTPEPKKDATVEKPIVLTDPNKQPEQNAQTQVIVPKTL